MSPETERPAGRITALLHRIVARPVIYDAMQTVAGVAYSDMRVRKAIARSASIPPGSTVIDVGGGTGRGRLLWPDTVRYVLVDNDQEKIDGFLRKSPTGEAICADAGALPFGDGTVDAAMVSAVTHHLPARVPELMFSEIRRVLKPDGRLVFMDAVWRRWRPIGRVLWRFDRGSYPRTKDEIRRLVDDQFDVIDCETYSVLHRYVLITARPRPKESQLAVDELAQLSKPTTV